MNDQNDAIGNITAQVLEQDDKNKAALAMLLDIFTNRKDELFVQRLVMGGTESFIGSVTLEWFADKVSFASLLPLFKSKLDEDGRVVIDKDTIDEVLQRPIDYSRQSELAQYLAARKRHKFPPVLVVVSQPWVDDPSSDEWDSSGRAVVSAANFASLDANGEFGLLLLSALMQIYALDGQHRLLGVIGLMELIRKGRLVVLNSKGKQIGDKYLTVDTLAEAYGLNVADIQALANEKIGIEFISAVVPGETRSEAKQRVRSIFVHVNRMAAPLTQGQLHQLDEDSGFSLIAKRVAIHHPLLMPEGRVNWNSNTISARSTQFTTLQTLAEMAKGYLSLSEMYSKWDMTSKGLIPMRPDDAALNKGEENYMELLNGLIQLPSIERMVQGTSSVELRNFTHDVVDKENGTKGVGNVLFRPVGQQVVAAALGAMRYEHKIPLDSLFDKLNAFDGEGGFSAIDKPKSIWYGVLYDPSGQRMLVKGRNLAEKLLRYLLGETLAEAERGELRGQLAEARTIEEQARDFDGKMVAPAKIRLPSPIVV